MVVAVALALALVLAVQARVRRAEARWGGAPVQVLVAGDDLPVGTTEPSVRLVEYPPAAVPADALDALPEGAVLALAVPRGAVLTAGHVDDRGPAAGLEDGLRAVPVPVEEGWGITAGAWVDVWVLGGGEEPARQVAASRSVLEVRRDASSRNVALVGMASEEVGDTTEGLALGEVLLTHAPPP